MCVCVCVCVCVDKEGSELTTAISIVNNAATGTMGPLLTLDPAAIEKTFAVNVFGFLHLIRSTVPHMPAGGRIINIGTVVSKLATPNWGVFAASKAAMDTITFVLASEVRRFTQLILFPLTRSDVWLLAFRSTCEHLLTISFTL